MAAELSVQLHVQEVFSVSADAGLQRVFWSKLDYNSNTNDNFPWKVIWTHSNDECDRNSSLHNMSRITQLGQPLHIPSCCSDSSPCPEARHSHTVTEPCPTETCFLSVLKHCTVCSKLPTANIYRIGWVIHLNTLLPKFFKGKLLPAHMQQGQLQK